MFTFHLFEDRESLDRYVIEYAKEHPHYLANRNVLTAIDDLKVSERGLIRFKRSFGAGVLLKDGIKTDLSITTCPIMSVRTIATTHGLHDIRQYCLALPVDQLIYSSTRRSSKFQPFPNQVLFRVHMNLALVEAGFAYSDRGMSSSVEAVMKDVILETRT